MVIIDPSLLFQRTWQYRSSVAVSVVKFVDHVRVRLHANIVMINVVPTLNVEAPSLFTRGGSSGNVHK